MRIKHIGPRKPYVPPPMLAYDLTRLKAVLPRLTVDEQRDVQRIIDANGVGYNVRYLADRYERLANTPTLTGEALVAQEARDRRDLEGA